MILWNYQNFWVVLCYVVVKSSFDRQQPLDTIIMHLVKAICQQRSSTISTHFQIFVYFGRFVVVSCRSVYKMSQMCCKKRTQRERHSSTSILWQWCVSIPTSFLLTIDWLICCHSTSLCNSTHFFSHRHTRHNTSN